MKKLLAIVLFMAIIQWGHTQDVENNKLSFTDIEKEFDFVGPLSNMSKRILLKKFGSIENYREMLLKMKQDKEKYSSYDFYKHKYKHLDKDFKFKISDADFQNLISGKRIQHKKELSYQDSLGIILRDEFENTIQFKYARKIFIYNWRSVAWFLWTKPEHIKNTALNSGFNYPFEFYHFLKENKDLTPPIFNLLLDLKKRVYSRTKDMKVFEMDVPTLISYAKNNHPNSRLKNDKIKNEVKNIVLDVDFKKITLDNSIDEKEKQRQANMFFFAYQNFTNHLTIRNGVYYQQIDSAYKLNMSERLFRFLHHINDMGNKEIKKARKLYDEFELDEYPILTKSEHWNWGNAFEVYNRYKYTFSKISHDILKEKAKAEMRSKGEISMKERIKISEKYDKQNIYTEHFHSKENATKYKGYDYLSHDYEFIDKDYKINISNDDFQRLLHKYRIYGNTIRTYRDSLTVVIQDEFDHPQQKLIAGNKLKYTWLRASYYLWTSEEEAKEMGLRYSFKHPNSFHDFFTKNESEWDKYMLRFMKKLRKKVYKTTKNKSIKGMEHSDFITLALRKNPRRIEDQLKIKEERTKMVQGLKGLN